MLTGKHFGRYEVGGKIGEGGMGQVYSAIDPELGRNVAIKLLPAEFTTDVDRRSRFRQEARVISALNHPNIITIYEIGESDDGSFLATEFVDGKTLRDVSRHESLTVIKILRIVEQAANALVAADAAKIVHRDIKPENIMVRGDSIVKLLDFGLAKPTADVLTDEGTSGKTLPGTVMGSARYMSPEQARGREVDERTDIWSLGVVLYEMLTGRAPFDGETTADTLANVIHKEPPPIAQILPNLPFELQRILRKALQKDREERYQSMKDLSLDIKDLVYDLEHATSGERAGHTTSSPAFSENPTMLHNTISADRQTIQKTVLTHIAPPATIRRTPILLAAAILIFGGFAFGAYRWYSGGAVPLAAGAFEKTQISRINTDGKVQLPAISSDGKYLAYVSGDIGSRSLVVRQIATDSVVTIVPPTNLNYSAVTFSPSGDYVYYCETRSDFSINTLYQVPTLGGTPKKLIDDVDSTVTFSPDGKQFAFMRHVSTTNEDIVFAVDTATLQMDQVTTTKDSGYDFFSARPAWSPDGKFILIGAGKRKSGAVSEMGVAQISLADKTFKAISTGKFFTVGSFAWFADGSGFLLAARETQTAPVQIWSASFPGMEFRQVTNDFNDYGEVGLSADGATIVTAKGEVNSSIWKLSPASKEPVQVTADSRNPEGLLGLIQTSTGQLLFTRREGKESKIWIGDGDGKNAKLISSMAGSAISPALTPDGRYIVFNLQKPNSSRIWRIDADGKNPIQLTPESPDSAEFNPQLTVDGSTIVFQRQIANTDRSVLMSMPIAGGEPTTLYDDKDHGVWGPRLSPDGTRIAFTAYNTANFTKTVMIATLTGTGIGQIEREIDYNLINQIAWAPDSKSLTLLTSRAGLPNLWSQPIDGSPAKAITDFKAGQIFNFAWTRDGKNLLLARGNINSDLILIRDPRRADRGPDVTRLGGSRSAPRS